MSSKCPRAPRVKPPSETPLDDGTRNGTEAWREVDGIAFCHWDRWLWRLSLEEPEGVDEMYASLADRSTRKLLHLALASGADLKS